MKCIIVLISIVFIQGTLKAQSFEGKVTYNVNFEIDEEKYGKLGVTKEMIVEKMKKEGEYYDKITYYFKKGNYIKEDNSSKNKRFIYKSDENMIYLFEQDSENVTLIKGQKSNILNFELDNSSIVINKSDSIKVIGVDTCKLVVLSWDKLSDEYYWYNPSKLNIKPELFRSHNYENLNKILTQTKAFPLEITRTVGKLMTITMTVEKIEEIDLNEELFKIPALKKSKRKSDKYVEKLTGNKVMKIKN